MSTTQAYGSRRSSAAVPQLDEATLMQDYRPAGTPTPATFTVVEGVANAHNIPSRGGSSLNSPSAPNRGYEVQPGAATPRQSAAALYAEQLEVAQTRHAVQRCPGFVAAAVLASLVEDYPPLAGTVRARIEQVLSTQWAAGGLSPNSAAVQQQQQRSLQQPPQHPGGGGHARRYSNMQGLWTGSPRQQQQQQQGGGLSPSSSVHGTPSNNRKARGGHKSKDDDQEMCSVHNNLRALKHLQLNNATGLYECIPGFHCLVEGTPTPDRRSATAAAAAAAPASRWPSSAQAPDGSNDYATPVSTAKYTAPGAQAYQDGSGAQQPPYISSYGGHTSYGGAADNEARFLEKQRAFQALQGAEAQSKGSYTVTQGGGGGGGAGSPGNNGSPTTPSTGTAFAREDDDMSTLVRLLKSATEDPAEERWD